VRVYCGTSGYSYQAWRGSFYPPDARPGELLGLYASRLPTVEINATFYRMPTARLLAGWRAQVPPRFAFALKGPQRITHVKRLVEVEEEAAWFHAAAESLGGALGPVLWQLPPSLKKDLPRLEAFLALLPAGTRPAFEFRHPSWFADEVYQALRRRGASLVVAHDGERETPLVATARTGYLRLRAPDYGPGELRGWAERVLAQPWEEAYVFFKHEDAGRGPALALAMLEVLGGSGVGVAPA
jgi:uncharacterized protein YecE (DUF72 family)